MNSENLFSFFLHSHIHTHTHAHTRTHTHVHTHISNLNMYSLHTSLRKLTAKYFNIALHYDTYRQKTSKEVQ